jgi:hypothetical protein
MGSANAAAASPRVRTLILARVGGTSVATHSRSTSGGGM